MRPDARAHTCQGIGTRWNTSGPTTDDMFTVASSLNGWAAAEFHTCTLKRQNPTSQMFLVTVTARVPWPSAVWAIRSAMPCWSKMPVCAVHVADDCSSAVTGPSAG